MEVARERSLNGRAIPSSSNERSYNGHYMAVGKEAEEIVIDFLRGRPQILEVTDFRDLKPVHKSDVDVAIETIDGLVTLAEIKSDYNLGVSGNVLFEVLRMNHTAPADKACTLGWSARTPAIWLLYYAPQMNSIYQCRTNDLRKVFQNYTSQARVKTKTVIIPTDKIKTTLCVLIPWEFCSHIFTIHELDNIPF